MNQSPRKNDKNWNELLHNRSYSASIEPWRTEEWLPAVQVFLRKDPEPQTAPGN